MHAFLGAQSLNFKEMYRISKDNRRQDLEILSISTEMPMLKEVPVVNGEK